MTNDHESHLCIKRLFGKVEMWQSSPGMSITSQASLTVTATVTTFELQTACRGSLLPDPRYDAVRAIVLAVMDDVEECPDGLYTARLMMFDTSGKPPKDAMNHVQVACFQGPLSLISRRNHIACSMHCRYT